MTFLCIKLCIKLRVSFLKKDVLPVEAWKLIHEIEVAECFNCSGS